MVEDVTVQRGGRDVLVGVSLRVLPGQLVAVTGASGAGKSTLLWTVAGLLPVASGQISLDGCAPAEVALVPQDNGLVPVLTAAENVEVALLARGLAAAETRDRAGAALAAVGLTSHADQLVEELSGGQQQRVAVARGMAVAPALLLADEVTSELDATNRQLVLELLSAHARTRRGRGLRHQRPRSRGRLRRRTPHRRRPSHPGPFLISDTSVVTSAPPATGPSSTAGQTPPHSASSVGQSPALDEIWSSPVASR
ncbi:ATP-binding cassette domain-containing protein [Fodinicola feengrottensis]|uniref:ATP-binding cassette domain-containing protein n=1 Tax=Fodinicola feengrottensis TaxID=435914 RepID=UPI0024423B08|nr:ATP-binding cassette domain-containing protein [Fodinicola feengrottensis]